jgi:C4-dicarboxylate-specific signal transduction histidine kinase
VLIGVASFESGSEGVAFVLDLTERKRAEAAAREMQLEHANRVATMGQLTASIAHEVKQPITAVISNAEGVLRWLGRRPLDLERIREGLGLIVKAGHRAGNVVDRIRALVKKAPLRNVRLNINETILVRV